MIGTTTSTVATAGIVAVGLWSDEKNISMKYVVGLGVMAMFLAVMGEANSKLAEQFGLLILVTAILLYGPKAAKGLGLVK